MVVMMLIFLHIDLKYINIQFIIIRGFASVLATALLGTPGMKFSRPLSGHNGR
jgi:hypothetical protein